MTPDDRFNTVLETTVSETRFENSDCELLERGQTRRCAGRGDGRNPLDVSKF